MSKTLVTILHFNSFQYTDALYEYLSPCEGEDYDLIIVDNGSEENKRGKYKEYSSRLEENLFFGGGLFKTFELFLSHTEYDSLFFVNSDIVVNDCSFIKTLKCELKDGYEIVSPAIMQPGEIQNHWIQMHNWNQTKIRPVQWIDLQAPFMSRKFVEYAFNKYTDFPKLGWGLEILFGIDCQNNGWKIGVCDFANATHLGSATINDNQHIPEIKNYCKNAEIEQWIYFDKFSVTSKAIEMRKWAENYIIENYYENANINNVS